MKRIYTAAHIGFLSKKISGRSYKELARLFNERFGLSVTEKAVKTLCGKYGLRNDYGRGIPHPEMRKYHDKHLNYLKEIVPGTPYEIVLEQFSKRFGFSLTVEALRSVCRKHGILNGFNGRFKKGNVPPNKGKKGYCAPGCEKGWFKPGQVPPKTMPIGSERITADGYVEVKYSNDSGNASKRWKGKQVLIWEKKNGPVPKGHAVIFADRNNRNFDLDNLLLVSRRELYALNSHGLLSANKDITKTSAYILRLRCLITDKKRGTLQSGGKKKLVVIDNKGNKIFIVQDAKTKRYFPARKTEKGIQKLRANLKSRKIIEEMQKDLIAYALKRGWHRA